MAMHNALHFGRWLIVSGAVTFLLLAGCSGGNEESAPGTDTTTTDTAASNDTAPTDTTPPDPPANASPWTIGDCADSITGTGKKIGDIAFDFVQPDQHGNPLRLHDFCDRVVLIKGAAYW